MFLLFCIAREFLCLFSCFAVSFSIVRDSVCSDRCVCVARVCVVDVVCLLDICLFLVGHHFSRARFVLMFASWFAQIGVG